MTLSRQPEESALTARQLRVGTPKLEKTDSGPPAGWQNDTTVIPAKAGIQKQWYRFPIRPGMTMKRVWNDIFNRFLHATLVKLFIIGQFKKKD